MTGEVIQLENVSKSFFFFKSIFARQELRALNGINLKINDGEFVGLIGKNGAGKTLLLKIISGIVYPSSGMVDIKKEVAPIFEYGTGFHPELNGRENIFLYASLLGIKMDEVKRNLENIVKTAELENFLDLKIKYFSTGMRIRLAFSVASILRPQIILLDETLSSADEEFASVVYRKIEELKQKKVTAIITSHDFDMLKRFCRRGIVLDYGKLVNDADIEQAINYYKRNVLLED